MQTFVVIPAFNESAVIGEVVSSVRNMFENVVVVDDGSTDDTHTQAAENGAYVLRHVLNSGQGTALRTGTMYAIKMGADIIVHFDADGQFRADEISELTRPIKLDRADVVLGSRFLQKNKVPVFRKLTLFAASIFTRFFSGIRLSDAQNGFRALSRAAALRIQIDQPGMAHNTEILDQIKKLRLRYEEVPVTVIYSEYSQKKGQSSLNAFRILKDLFIGRILK